MVFDRLRFKIEELRRYIEVLDLYRYAGLEDLEQDPDLRNSAENSMQVAADCTLDIAGIVLSEQGIEEKEDYMERICALGEIEVLEEEFAQRLALTADYWDVLLQHRTKVDVAETHHHIQSIADDLRHFIERISEYAESDIEDRDIDFMTDSDEGQDEESIEPENEEASAESELEQAEAHDPECGEIETIGEEIEEEMPSGDDSGAKDEAIQ